MPLIATNKGNIVKDQRTHYRKAIEVVGMLGSRRTLHNALNRIAAQTEDMELASLFHF